MKTLFIASFLLFSHASLATLRNELEWRFESYLTYTQRETSSFSGNPGNGIFETPYSLWNSDNRLESKWLINDAKVIARPRWVYQYADIKNDLTKDKTVSKGNLNLTDAFWEQVWSRKMSTTLGLQVYQWGPSEVFNASNPFFRFQKDQQTFAFKEKGKVLTRLNYNLSQSQSLVVILEPISNNEAYWMSEKTFKSQMALKYEINPKNSRNYIGLVSGIEHQGNSFVGEYAQYEFKPGFSFILDGKSSYGYEFYFPKRNAAGSYDFVSNADDPKEWSHIVASGFRYEGDFDMRIEGIYNSAGYDKSNLDAALASISNFSSANYTQNVYRFSNTGLNLMTRSYVYASFRATNPFSTSDCNLYLRTLNGLTDSSGLAQGEFDFSTGDHFTWFGSYTHFYGKEGSEFTLTDRWRAQVGGKFIL